MAIRFNGTWSHFLHGSYDRDSDLTTLKQVIDFAASSAYTNGTGSNQVNGFYADTRTLAATSENFDFDSGSMTDGYTSNLIFTKIKFLYIKNNSSTTGQNLVLSGDWLGFAVTGPISAGGTVTIGPGGTFVLDNPIDGYPVSSGITQDVLTVTNTTTFTYDIIILGVIL